MILRLNQISHNRCCFVTKQLTAIVLSLMLCIVFSFSLFALAPTFFDDFTDHNKSEAKSDNIIYEIDSSQENNTIITLNKPGEGYIIWKLDDLAYAKLGVLVFDGHNEKIESCIKLSSSNDGVSWQSLEYSSNLTTTSEWDSYLLSAETTSPQKFFKVTVTNQSDIAWSVKLDNLELYNSIDKPTNTPRTGKNLFLYYILTCGSVFYLNKLKTKRR